MSRPHPDTHDIDRYGKGPAIITYNDGTEHRTFNLAYTTCLKYETIKGRKITAKGTSIKHIEWVPDEAIRNS